MKSAPTNKHSGIAHESGATCCPKAKLCSAKFRAKRSSPDCRGKQLSDTFGSRKLGLMDVDEKMPTYVKIIINHPKSKCFHKMVGNLGYVTPVANLVGMPQIHLPSTSRYQPLMASNLFEVPSGKLAQTWKITIEIVDFPMKKTCDFPQCC